MERKSAFVDRDEAKLVLELEVAIQASPKFEIDRFRESLRSKDMYDNGTVSRQHVIQVTAAFCIFTADKKAMIFFEFKTI